MNRCFPRDDPFPEPSRPKVCRPAGSVCKCCAARTRALALALFDVLPECQSPLTPGVQAVNLIRNHNGTTLQVKLGEDWPRLLSQLHAVGPGLMMSRNDGAILGSRQPYPLLHFTAQSQTKGANAEAGLWLDCRGFGGAFAQHLKLEQGNFFGVEFTDTTGRIVHRSSLPPDSDLDEFCGWVRLHQACSAPPSRWKDPDEEIPGRSASEAAERSDPGAIFAIVSACVQRGLSLRATIFAGPIRQRAEFTPLSICPVENWWFASNDTVGLHFCGDHFVQVRVSPPLGGKYYAAPALYADTADHAPALVLEGGHPAQAAEWNAVVHGFV